MSGSEKDYTHVELNQEVNAIGGRYTLTKEVRLPFNDLEILYVVGSAMFDTTCCGYGGCNYAMVQGFIIEWKTRQDDEGRHITRVELILDQALQKEIKALIEKQETVSQVNFY